MVKILNFIQDFLLHKRKCAKESALVTIFVSSSVALAVLRQCR
jgi:hypothetical protein